jgi:hypothetical protein
MNTADLYFLGCLNLPEVTSIQVLNPPALFIVLKKQTARFPPKISYNGRKNLEHPVYFTWIERRSLNNASARCKSLYPVTQGDAIFYFAFISTKITPRETWYVSPLIFHYTPLAAL